MNITGTLDSHPCFTDISSMEPNHEHLIPVPILEFISGTTTPVNLYIRLGEDKFILIAKSGSRTDRERLQTYENKTVEYLWVRKEDYGKLAKNNLMIAGIIVNQQSLDAKQKSQVLTQAAASVFRELDYIGLGFEAYSHSKQIVEATVALADSHRDLNDLFSGLHDVAEPLLRHSMAVACVSVLIAQALRWENKQTVEKLAMGALLHDVGFKALPPEIIGKPKAKMTYEEIQLYEQHPYKGMKMLLELGIVPDDVIAIVYEHHENSIGQGYPRKLRNLKIHPLARIVAVADEFCDLTLANVNNPHPKSPREAVLTIETTMGQPFNKEAFRALQLIVNKEFARTG